MATTLAQSRTVFAVPIAVGFFFMAMMLPTAVSLNLGGLRLSAYRIVLIVMIVPMMVQLLSGQRGRINLFDMLLFAHCSWALLALIKWAGLAQGIETGGIYIVECAGAYLLGSIYIRSSDDFTAMSRAYVSIVLATLVFTVPEALTGIHILHDGISSAVGGPSPVH